ncbi:MAG TPA: hypothetical protein VFB04_09695 [Terriglobales bacterium]|nr:hypothetical protein [Terriglobales bacterium]
MKYRIGTWAATGFLIAYFWAWFLFPTAPIGSTPILTLARLTCPVALMGFGLHVGWVLLANAATYALIGLVLEFFRNRIPSRQI